MVLYSVSLLFTYWSMVDSFMLLPVWYMDVLLIFDHVGVLAFLVSSGNTIWQQLWFPPTFSCESSLFFVLNEWEQILMPWVSHTILKIPSFRQKYYELNWINFITSISNAYVICRYTNCVLILTNSTVSQ